MKQFYSLYIIKDDTTSVALGKDDEAMKRFGFPFKRKGKIQIIDEPEPMMDVYKIPYIGVAAISREREIIDSEWEFIGSIFVVQ